MAPATTTTVTTRGGPASQKGRASRNGNQRRSRDSLHVRFPSTRPQGFPNPSFAPPFTRRTLRYNSAVAQTTTAGGLGISYFRALSLFSPAVVGSHQPMGFDQMMIFYNKYCVLASKMSVSVIVQTVPQVVGIQLLKGTTTAYANYTGICESGLCTYRAIPSALSVPYDLSLAQLTSKSMGVRAPQDDDELCGTSATDPADPLMFAVFNQDINLSSIATTQFMVTIEYDTIFSEPRQTLQS